VCSGRNLLVVAVQPVAGCVTVSGDDGMLLCCGLLCHSSASTVCADLAQAAAFNSLMDSAG